MTNTGGQHLPKSPQPKEGVWERELADCALFASLKPETTILYTRVTRLLPETEIGAAIERDPFVRVGFEVFVHIALAGAFMATDRLRHGDDYVLWMAFFSSWERGDTPTELPYGLSNFAEFCKYPFSDIQELESVDWEPSLSLRAWGDRVWPTESNDFGLNEIEES